MGYEIVPQASYAKLEGRVGSATYNQSVNNGPVVNINIGNITVNKFYNGDVVHGNVNNGIQHSIAVEKGNVNCYSSIDSIVNTQNNYVVNLDSPPREFIPPYIGAGVVGYDNNHSGYLLPAPGNSNYNNQTYENTITSGLLSPNRPLTQFIDKAADIEEFVKETFQLLTGMTFPENIIVRICNEDEMRKAHKLHSGGKDLWTPGILGFAINRHPDNSMVFVKENHLDEIMLTLGHEIGHVVAPKLNNAIDEEAKAFAFEMAWAKTIVENDIANLSSSFNTNFVPAANGVHDKAFGFVQRVISKGFKAIDVFKDIAKGILKVD